MATSSAAVLVENNDIHSILDVKPARSHKMMCAIR